MKPTRLHQSVCCLIVLSLWAALSLPTLAQEPGNQPPVLQFSLEAGQCTTDALVITTGQAPLPTLDVLFLIDVTASMDAELAAVRRTARPLADAALALAPDSRFAVATVADYPGIDRSTDIEPWTLVQDFTSEPAQVDSAIEDLTLFDSGDEGESYLRAFAEAAALDWRSEASRVLVFFGDAVPVDPDPGPDAQLNTRDDLTLDDALTQLTDQNIIILAAYARFPGFYQELTAATNGQAFPIAAATQMQTVVPDLLADAVPRFGVVTLEATSPGDEWLTWQPTLYRNVESRRSETFNLTLCVPDDALGGNYDFTLRSLADENELGETSVNITVPARADLVLNQEISANPSPAVEELTYRLSVRNRGPDPAEAVRLRYRFADDYRLMETRPALEDCALEGTQISCLLGNLAVDESISIEFVGLPVEEGQFLLSAEVQAEQTDPNPSQNRLDERVTIGPRVNLVLEQSAFAADITAGQPTEYQFTLRNEGLAQANDVLVRHPLPAGAELVESKASQGSCVEADGTLTCELGTLTGGGTATVDVQLIPAQGGRFENTIAVVSNETDEVRLVLATDAPMEVVPVADLALSLTTQPEEPFRIGQGLAYALQVANNGPSAASELQTRIELPAHLDGAARVGERDCRRQGQMLTCETTGLAPAETALVTLAVTPSQSIPVTFTASIAAQTQDPAPANNRLTSNALPFNPVPPWWLFALLAVPFAGIFLWGWLERR